MKRLTVIPMLLALMACSLFVPMSPAPPATDTLVPLPISPTETFMAVCTPPACNADETYVCPGDCPGGCGTVCATVTPDAAFAPLATVDGAGMWIARNEEMLVSLDPSGVNPGFALQRLYAPVADFFLTRDGNIYSLTDTGNGALELRQAYPRERLIANLDTRRDVDGSPRTAPIFSADGANLVWSRADEDGTMTRTVFVTSLETGESREVWRAELPEEAAGHALIPIFCDEARQVLVYALHAFYSGMMPTQVASLYVADISADEITPLWTLNPVGMHAGVSAAVSPNGSLLAYLTWGDLRSDFTLSWTLHIRDLSNGDETTYALNETWGNAGVHLFSPDSNKLLFTASRRDANGDYQTEMLVFDLQIHTWNSIYTPDYDTKPYFNPRAWTDDDWLILANADDDSTWVMRPNGESLTQITPLEWLGMLAE